MSTSVEHTGLAWAIAGPLMAFGLVGFAFSISAGIHAAVLLGQEGAASGQLAEYHRRVEAKRPQMDAVADQIAAALEAARTCCGPRWPTPTFWSSQGRSESMSARRPAPKCEPVLQRATWLVWDSRLDPLHTVRIVVRDGADPTRARSAEFDKPMFQSRYGPRR